MRHVSRQVALQNAEEHEAPDARSVRGVGQVAVALGVGAVGVGLAALGVAGRAGHHGIDPSEGGVETRRVEHVAPDHRDALGLQVSGVGARADEGSDGLAPIPLSLSSVPPAISGVRSSTRCSGSEASGGNG
jgi:hypothetical protein